MLTMLSHATGHLHGHAETSLAEAIIVAVLLLSVAVAAWRSR